MQLEDGRVVSNFVSQALRKVGRGGGGGGANGDEGRRIYFHRMFYQPVWSFTLPFVAIYCILPNIIRLFRNAVRVNSTNRTDGRRLSSPDIRCSPHNQSTATPSFKSPSLAHLSNPTNPSSNPPPPGQRTLSWIGAMPVSDTCARSQSRCTATAHRRARSRRVRLLHSAHSLPNAPSLSYFVSFTTATVTTFHYLVLPRSSLSLEGSIARPRLNSTSIKSNE